MKGFSHQVNLSKREKIKFIKRQKIIIVWLFWWCVYVCKCVELSWIMYYVGGYVLKCVVLCCIVRQLCAMLDYRGVVCLCSSLFVYIHSCMYSCIHVMYVCCMLLNCVWEYVWVVRVRILAFHIVWCSWSVASVAIYYLSWFLYGDGMQHIQFGYIVNYMYNVQWRTLLCVFEQ